jgi:hypothetical protein
MKKQKELDRLTKELVKQMTGNEVEDAQEGDYQIAYYYLSKAMDYTRCCTELKDKKALTFEEWLYLNNYAKSNDAKYLDENANWFTEKQLLKMYNDIF